MREVNRVSERNWWKEMVNEQRGTHKKDKRPVGDKDKKENCDKKVKEK